MMRLRCFRAFSALRRSVSGPKSPNADDDMVGAVLPSLFLGQNFRLLLTASSWPSPSAFRHPRQRGWSKGGRQWRDRFIWGVWIPGKEGRGDVCGSYVWEFVISWIHFATPTNIYKHGAQSIFVVHGSNKSR
jgi:hypothetical protein